MNDFNKPIRPIKKIQEISSKKDIISSYSKDQSYLSEDLPVTEKKKTSLLSKLKLIKDFFYQIAFFSKKNPGLLNISAKKSLIDLKSQLTKIGENDPSTHPAIALEFSTTWKELLEFFQQNPSDKAQLLVDSFKTFPGKASYSLHFYLTRFSGKEWFPLPFFELLKSLHVEYRNNQKNSQIDRWIHLIDEMLTNSFVKETD